MTKDRLDIVKDHFDSEAGIFDEHIVKLVPYYKEMLDALVSNLPFSEDKRIKVLDLGCGTGTIVKLIKRRFSNAQITCLDFAQNMLDTARAKLKDYSDIDFELADITKYEFKDKYDAVVSSLALHHLETNEDKKAFHKKIYTALNKNGIFINADVTLASNEYFQKIYIEKWKDYMRRSISEEEVQKTLQKYYNEDRPAVLLDEIAWLKEIGFRQVEIFWKYYGGAVYGAVK